VEVLVVGAVASVGVAIGADATQDLVSGRTAVGRRPSAPARRRRNRRP